MNINRVVIIILNWNGYPDTEACISSLLKQTYENYHIVVVDNGSQPSSVKNLNNLEKNLSSEKITFLFNKTNLGFAGGVNTGIRYALKEKFDAIALFNNDATADKDWLKELEKELAMPDVGIVTGLLLHQDGKTIDSTGECYSHWGMPFPRYRNRSRSLAPDSGFVFGASGGASLYRSDVFHKIGLFDEDFFAYYEDVDISFRTQLAGYKVYYKNTAIAYHAQGASSKKIPGFTIYQTFKNIPLLYVKNIPRELFFQTGFRLLVLYSLYFINAIKNGSGQHAFRGWIMSIFYFWKSSLWKRFSIQKNKKVKTIYIKKIMAAHFPPKKTNRK